MCKLPNYNRLSSSDTFCSAARNPVLRFKTRDLKTLVRSIGLKHGQFSLAQKIHGVVSHAEEAGAEQTPDQTLHISLEEAEEEASMASVSSTKGSLNCKDDVAVMILLKDCIRCKDLSTGIRLHADISNRGCLHTNSFISNTFINMYAKCGALTRAQQTFNELIFPDIISWNTLMAGYCEHGQWIQALCCFDRIQHQGFSPDGVTLSCTLKACGRVGAIGKGKQVHAAIITDRLWMDDIVLGTAVVDMYAKCGVLSNAQKALDELPLRNVVSWNALISGYCQHGQHEKALSCFRWMKQDGISPNTTTFACTSKACGGLHLPKESQMLHAEIVREGLPGHNAILGSALVDMYINCDGLEKACQLFDELRVRDIVSWTGMITGYCRYGRDEDALKSLERLRYEGLFPNAVTFSCILKSCGRLGAAEKGREVHTEVLRKGLIGRDTILGSALADMYAKCSAITCSREVFSELSSRDVIAWNAVIAQHCRDNKVDEAVKCFDLMKSEHLTPDAATFTCMLKACGKVGAANFGKDLHGEIVRRGLISDSSVLRNALVDMYAKCGTLAQLQQLFEELPNWDVVGWNALIAGLCNHEQGKKALDCFERMKNEGLFPDEVTFANILKACGRIGEVAKGHVFFETLSTPCGIVPSIAHQASMVDLFGRAGHLEMAMSMAKEVAPPVESYSAWFALLGLCEAWGNEKRARAAFESAIEV